MTRLTTDDIATIADELEAYDSKLLSKTGCTLCGIACRAAGVEESEIKKLSGNLLVGVIPITFGGGVISGFCESVAGIVSHIGCRAFVTSAADIAGIAEAVEKKADILMFADDDRFVAIDMANRQCRGQRRCDGKGLRCRVGFNGRRAERQRCAGDRLRPGGQLCYRDFGKIG